MYTVALPKQHSAFAFTCTNVHIAGNFRGRNFHKFRGSAAIRESFLHENGCGPLWFIAHYIRSVVNSQKFLHEILYFTDS